MHSWSSSLSIPFSCITCLICSTASSGAAQASPQPAEITLGTGISLPGTSSFMRSPVFLLSFSKNHRLPRQYSYLPQSLVHIKMYLFHNSTPDVNPPQQRFSCNNKVCFLESAESPILQKMTSKYSCNYVQVSPHISRFQKLLPVLEKTHHPSILCRW